MARHEFDHEITIGATTHTLVLARDAKGAPIYQVSEEAASPQLLTYIQNDWQGGFGLLNWEDPTRYAEGEKIDTSWPGVVFCGPALNATTGLTAAPKKFYYFEAASLLMCITAQGVWTLSGSAWTLRLDLAAVGTAEDLIEYKGILYVAVSTAGAPAKYYYTANGTAYTQTDLTDGFAVRFLVSPNAAGTAEVLWAVTPTTANPLGINEIRNTTDGRTVAAGGVQWTSPWYVGDTSTRITEIGLLSGNILVGKTDGLFLLDNTGATVPLMPEIELARGSALNFMHTNSQGILYALLGGRIWEITSLTSFRLADPFMQTKGIDIGYTCRGLASDFWGNLYAIYIMDDDNLEIVIYKGVPLDGKMSWHPWARWTLASAVDPLRSLTVIAHSVSDFRLWFGQGTTAQYIKVAEGHNPLAHSTGDVITGGFIRTSYFTAPARFWPKFLLSVVTETEGCTANRTITLKYRKDTETAFTAATAAITTNGIVQTFLTNALNFKRIQIEVDFATNVAATSPVLRHLELRGVTIPEVVRIYDATYQIGQSRTKRATTLRDFLRTGRTTTSLIKFADLRHNETTLTGTAYHYVVMLPGYPQEVEITHEKGADPEMGIRCRFVEVDFPEA